MNTAATPQTPAPVRRSLRGRRIDWGATIGTSITASATGFIILFLFAILTDIAVHGLPALSWRFVSTIPRKGRPSKVLRFVQIGASSSTPCSIC
jgi:hypothetical protein